MPPKDNDREKQQGLSFEEASRLAADARNAERQAQERRAPGSFNRAAAHDPVRDSYGSFLREQDEARFRSLAQKLHDRRDAFRTEQTALSGKAEHSEYEKARFAYLNAALEAERRLSAIEQNAPAADDEPTLEHLAPAARDPRRQASMVRHGEEALDSYLSASFDLLRYDRRPAQNDPSYQQALAEETQFNAMYSEAAALRNELERLHSGGLIVPQSHWENGKYASFVDGTAYEPRIDFAKLSRPEQEARRRDALHTDYEDRRSEPLFAHLPSAADVGQGRLGNCYMLASLTALAMQDPERIMDAMRDNGDTATVRFYNNKQEPIYVTVDKTVPQLHLDPVNGSAPVDSDAYAQGALWVQILEKAYVQSGIHMEADDDMEEGGYEAGYQDIRSGTAEDFLKHFLGSDEKAVRTEDHTISVRAGNGGRDRTYANYSAEQVAFARQVADACHAGKLVTCATVTVPGDGSDKKAREYEARNFADPDNRITLRDAGLVTGHAYTVNDVVFDNDRIYMAIRNPHNGRGILKNDAGQLQVEAQANGYSLVELDVFRQHFSNTVYQTEIDLGPASYLKTQQTEEMARKYAGTVKLIRDSLLQSDSSLIKRPFNTQKFTDFRDAAGLAVAALEREQPNEGEIRRSMEKLFQAAQAYNDRCVNEKKLDPASAKQNELERWKLAKVTQALSDIYHDPAHTGEVSFHRLSRDSGVPSTGYEFLWKARQDAERKAQTLRDGTPEERQAAGEQLSDFFAKKQYARLDPNALMRMSPAEQFEYLRRPENQKALESVLIIASHAEDAVNSIQRSGKRVTETEVRDVKKKSEHLSAFADGIMAALDVKRYEADRVNSVAELRDFNTLHDRLDTAMKTLGLVDPKKEAARSRERERQLGGPEAPSVKAPQRGGPTA